MTTLALAGYIAAAVIALAIAVIAVVFVYRRPQRGILLLAMLTPLHGLLAILPLPGIATAWKEGLLILTAICAVMRRSRTPVWNRTAPLFAPWWPAVALWLAFGAASALFTFGVLGFVAIKVTYFFVSIVVVLWFAPFDARDRDHFVSILMGMAALASVVGIGQLIVGPGFLVSLGYQWGREVRTSGGLLRTFSTFVQPFPFGLYVMLAILVGGAVALAEPSRRRNQLFLWLIPVMTVAMASSIVRAAILGLVLGVLWLAVLRFRILLLPLAVGGLAVGIAVPLVPSISKVFLSSSSLGERSAGWSDIISSILIHPIGLGLGSSGAAADRMSTASGTTIYGVSMNYQPDNYYVKMLLELGPIGLWLILTVFLTALVWTTRLAWTLPGRDGALALGISAAIVAGMAACMVATYLEIFPIDVYFWLFLGVIGCAAAQHDSRRQPSITERLPSVPEGAGYRPTSASS
jgi:hypothetical protein